MAEKCKNGEKMMHKQQLWCGEERMVAWWKKGMVVSVVRDVRVLFESILAPK